MAFGGLKGTLSGNANSITNPFAATGSVSVVVGDLVFAVLVQQTTLSVTGVTDNLGNTYTATNAGTDAGAVTARAFQSRVTVAGTLTSVSAATAGGTNDVAFLAAVIEGPFETVALDKNIANITTDITSPFTAPSSGVLGQDREVVIGWGAANYGTVWAATSPNLLAGNVANSTTVKVAIGYQAVSATTAVLPAFTAGANPTQSVLGISTFRQRRGLTLQGNLAYSGTAPSVGVSDHLTRTPPQGDVALSSAAPARLVSDHLTQTPLQGNAALSGTAPARLVSAHSTITPAQGNLALSAAAPEAAVVTPVLRFPPAGNLYLYNGILDENGDYILDENNDPITDASTAPGLALTFFTYLLPPAGNLAFSSVKPELQPVFPPRRDIVLSSSPPTLLISANSVPRGAQLLLIQNWILDESGDLILDETDDPLLDDIVNNAPSVQVGRLFNPAAADLIISGTAPGSSLSINFAFTPAAANLALSVVAPSIRQPLTPPAGALFLIDALLDDSGEILTDDDGEILTSDDDEQSPIVTQTFSGSYYQPLQADLALSSAAPEVLRSGVPTALAPAAAQALLNNWIVDESGDPIRDENDAIIVDGDANAPVVTQLANTYVGAGDLVLSATAPSLSVWVGTIAPASGDLALSSVAPAILTAGQISPANTDLTLSSNAPTVAQSLNIGVGAGNVVLSATAPTVLVGINSNLAPARADLILSSSAATVVQALNAAPAVGNLTLSSAAPTVIVEIPDLVPANANLVLSGSAPSIFVPVNLNPAAANLLLSVVGPHIALPGDLVRIPAAGNVFISSPPLAMEHTFWEAPDMGKAALLIDDLAPDGNIFASSEELAMPVVNLLTPNPSERWRSNTAAAWFVLDLLTAQSFDHVLLKGLTGGATTQIRIRLSSSDPSGVAGDVYDTGMMADGSLWFDLDYETLSYRWIVPQSCRYIRVDIEDPAADYVEVGLITVGLLEVFYYNFMPGGNITYVDRSRLGRTSGGQILTWNDNTYRRVEINFDWVTTEQRYGLFERMHRVNGAHKNVMLLLDISSSNLARDSILGLITPPAVSYLNVADEFGPLYSTQLKLEERL